MEDSVPPEQRFEAPLPPLRPRPKCNFIHPRQLSPFPERLELPFSNDEISSGYEDIVSSGTDHFTSWVKMSERTKSWHSMWVDIHKAAAEFRETFKRKPATSSHKNSSYEHFATRLGCAEETQHLQLEPLTTTGKRRCLRETNWVKVAYHYLARDIRLRRPRASHESLPRDPLRRLCSSLQQGHLSTPTSMSSPSTFMTPGETCQIKSWKENREGSCKVFFHVPHFVDHQ